MKSPEIVGETFNSGVQQRMLAEHAVQQTSSSTI